MEGEEGPQKTCQAVGEAGEEPFHRGSLVGEEEAAAGEGTRPLQGAEGVEVAVGAERRQRSLEVEAEGVVEEAGEA